MTLFVLKYKIEVIEELQFAGETFEQKKARVLDGRHVVTLTCVISTYLSEFAGAELLRELISGQQESR